MAVLEPFVAVGQMLPRDGFVQAFTPDSSCRQITLSRTTKVIGASPWGRRSAQGRWGGRGRRWSNCSELVISCEGEPAEWDLVPQLQVTLSKRQHVMVNGGLRLPLNVRVNRSPSVVVCCLWDWFDGGFFEGWR